MIRHDLDNVDWQPTSVPVKQQVRQTMGRFGGQDEGTDGTPQLVDVDSSVALSASSLTADSRSARLLADSTCNRMKKFPVSVLVNC